MEKPILTPVERDIIRLFRRSTPDADGWYQISAALWGFINHHIPSRLAEKEETSSGGRMRLTREGEDVWWSLR